MKILIMVLTYMRHPYDELYKSQTETWDTIEVDGVRTVYYHGASTYPNYIVRRVIPKNSVTLMVNETDSYYYMAGKFKAALDYVKDWDYDIVFRTNSSSYVNKKKLKEFAETLPKEKLYAGWTMIDSEDHGGLVVSGAGIWLSRDTAEMLREQIDPTFEQEEDIYCGRILRRNRIVATDDKSRCDVNNSYSEIPLDRYHYRFKTGDRAQDAENMKQVHKMILQ